MADVKHALAETLKVGDEILHGFEGAVARVVEVVEAAEDHPGKVVVDLPEGGQLSIPTDHWVRQAVAAV